MKVYEIYTCDGRNVEVSADRHFFADQWIVFEKRSLGTGHDEVARFNANLILGMLLVGEDI